MELHKHRKCYESAWCLKIVMKKLSKQQQINRFLKNLKENNTRPIEKWTWIDLHRDCQSRNNLRIVRACSKA